MKTVRNGQVVWPYCHRCGCRLEMNKTPKGELYFRHFEGRNAFFNILTDVVYADARGCRCVDEVWAVEDKILYLS